MNPNSPSPGFELPTPQSNEGASDNGATHEQLSAAPNESASQPAASQGVPTVNPILASAPPVTPQPAAPISTNPTLADDNDLIEKEWVLKAKQIVAGTKDDPYVQNKEISRFKADYLKKRYNKDIKLEDS